MVFGLLPRPHSPQNLLGWTVLTILLLISSFACFLLIPKCQHSSRFNLGPLQLYTDISHISIHVNVANRHLYTQLSDVGNQLRSFYQVPSTFQMQPAVSPCLSSNHFRFNTTNLPFIMFFPSKAICLFWFPHLYQRCQATSRKVDNIMANPWGSWMSPLEFILAKPLTSCASLNKLTSLSLNLLFWQK